MLQADVNAFRAINGLAGKSALLDAFGIFSARWLIVVMFGAVALRGLFAFRRPETRSLLGILTMPELRAMAACVVAFFATWGLNQMMGRTRPFVTLVNVSRLIPPPLTQFAFPSGHATAAFALAFTMMFADARWGAALVVGAVGVSFGRVFTGVHYPLDVLSGMFMGLLWASALHCLVTPLLALLKRK